MRFIRVAAMLLAISFLFTGCFYSTIFYQMDDHADDYWGNFPFSEHSVSFQNMEYARPDMEAFQRTLDRVCETAETTDSFTELTDAIAEYDTAYSDFLTNYHLANILYSSDLTDSHWEEEYTFCLERIPTVDQGTEQLYRVLARCPFREDLETDEYFGEDFFDAYDGEALYDDYFMSLTEQEATLESRYYELCDQADPYSKDYYSTDALEMAQLYVDLIALRQKIADYAGYDSFPHYTYDTYYGRDYTPEQAQVYLEATGDALYAALYSLYVADDWGYYEEYCSESTALRYVRNAADAMGGNISEAFAFLESNRLYDISYGVNKYNASFEVYLPSYSQPFIFMNPNMTQSDKLTFAHEFGHFANDYVCGGSYAGIDVAEVHSQAFEYLSLCYGKEDQDLINYKMVDSLLVHMQCAAHALFELQAYQLTGDDLTVENIFALYEDVGYRFGFENWNWNSRDFVQITHFYTSPLYMVSYVVSNDLAMQIYQKELEVSGEGLALYQKCLESQESRIVQFATEYGLESPFAEDRPQQIALFYAQAFSLFIKKDAVAA